MVFRKGARVETADGLVAPQRRVVPAHWIRQAGDDQVELGVSARQVEALEPYAA